MTAAPVTTVGAVTVREVAAVEGRIVSVTIEPRDAAPQLTARIDDGTGRIDAIFMGRREIAGIEPGARVTIEGRVCSDEAGLRVYNPRFELR
ncbi:OB-fold nucleic acid binding domain-containing protein [Demequina sp. NBRC 110056]|uniref:OB-fold nucleic acid binding domain-containing protein n=1 Tax=Demequina sp. NBRC 110056 TaxID=1570345 RepID=UPI000A048590|nr:OB-fold nucleic acid binding domain-containing protein [Demequina sp. NBRC 110056]